MMDAQPEYLSLSEQCRDPREGGREAAGDDWTWGEWVDSGSGGFAEGFGFGEVMQESTAHLRSAQSCPAPNAPSAAGCSESTDECTSQNVVGMQY